MKSFYAFKRLVFGEGAAERVSPSLQLLLLTVLIATGCASVSYKNGIITTPDAKYKIQPPPTSRWSGLEVEDSDAAFKSKTTSAVMSVNSTCGEEYRDAKPEVLTRHLLMGMSDKKIVEQKILQIAGREGLVTQAEGKLDGVLRAIMAFVINRDWCTYDVTLIVAPDELETVKQDFKAVVESFGVLKK